MQPSAYRTRPATDPNALRFPTSIAVDPSGQWVYVASSNFDTGWWMGTVRPFPVARAEELITAGSPGTPGHPPIAALSDAKMAAANAIQIDSFAGDLGFASVGSTLLGFVPSRDTDLVEWFTATPGPTGAPVLDCAARAGFLPCDSNHQVSIPWTDPATNIQYLARDPFALAAGAGLDPSQPLVYVGSIEDGTFTVLSVVDGKPAMAAAIALNAGLHSIREGALVSGRRIVYASNRELNAIHVVSISAGANGALLLDSEDAGTAPEVTGTSDFFRGLALSKDGTRLFAAYRSPTALAVFDVQPDGLLGFRGLVPLNGAPGEVAVAGGTGTTPESVYVTDYLGDNVYVIDPVALSVTARIIVGDGPYGIAILDDDAANLHRAYVSLFEADSVSVVDLVTNTEIGRVQ
jgi:YVTN family beta-propeller protein